MKLIEIELFQVVILEKSLTQIIVLREKGGERIFPIYIGFNEAMAIDRKLNNRQVPRPLTHDLLQTIIERLGGKLERIVINDLQEQTFFARLDIRHETEIVEVDSRPSDAIALAVRVGAPIFVAERILVETQSGGSMPGPGTIPTIEPPQDAKP
jgi:hypothetical protein